MDARFSGGLRPLARARSRCALVVLATALSGVAQLHAAGFRSTNFAVEAPTAQLAQEIAASAEAWRKSLALEWLGAEMPAWSKPCPIHASVSPTLLAGGETSFVFDRGEVFGWRMRLQGTRERVLDSVLPHEITHTIFACHFRQPLPRWADEGACTTVEHRSEIAKHERLLVECLMTRRGIPFDDMFAMKEYPADILPLYAQGYALSQYLIGQKGKREFLEFLADGMEDGNWPRAVKLHYNYPHLLALQTEWQGWVAAGKPPVRPAADTLATNDASRTPPIIRGQSPEQSPGDASPSSIAPTAYEAALSQSTTRR